MAITWKLSGKVTNITEKRAIIIGVRTDDTDPDNPRAFGPLNAILETAAQRLDVLTTFKKLKTDDDVKISAAQDILDTILSSGETSLNEWELE
jgi:hypothetical protein